MKNLHANIDELIKKVDVTKAEALEFQEQWGKQLDDKKKFYDDLDSHKGKKSSMGDMENSYLDDNGQKYSLDPKQLEDIRFGAETLRTTVKEKYLGRDKGAKRGETDVEYGSSNVF